MCYLAINLKKIDFLDFHTLSELLRNIDLLKSKTAIIIYKFQEIKNNFVHLSITTILTFYTKKRSQ